MTAMQVKIGERRADHYSEAVRYAESLLDLVGNTPLVKLGKTTDGAKPLVLAKVEYFNPGGSVKDRIAVRMIEAAEASGELKPGGTIVEPTSGNTGVGLAMVAQQKGYKCVFVCPDKVSEDKRNVLKAYGAEVVVCPTAVAPEHPDSYYNVSDRLVREIEGAWKPTSTPTRTTRARTTRPPARRSGSRPTGRSPTSSPGSAPAARSRASASYLKEVSGGKVQIIGADPAGSVYSGGTGRPYLVEGVGEDFWPETYDRTICDRVIEVSDADSFALHPAAGPRGGHAGRRFVRAWRPRRAIRLAHELDDPGSRHRRTAAGRRPRLPDQGLQRRLAGAVRLPRARPARASRSARSWPARTAACRRWCTPTRTRRSPRRSRSCASTASRRCRSSGPSRR